MTVASNKAAAAAKRNAAAAQRAEASRGRGRGGAAKAPPAQAAPAAGPSVVRTVTPISVAPTGHGGKGHAIVAAATKAVVGSAKATASGPLATDGAGGGKGGGDLLAAEVASLRAELQRQKLQYEKDVDQLKFDNSRLRLEGQHANLAQLRLRKEIATLQDAAEQSPHDHRLLQTFLAAMHATLLLGEIPGGKYIAVNPCLFNPRSTVVRRFLAGVRHAGTSLSDLVSAQRDAIVVGFHGSSTANGVLHEGFDPAKRGGQVHGPGEYFATDWKTAEHYATREGDRRTSAVVVTLLIESTVKRVTSHNGDKWYVVENPLPTAADTASGRRPPTYCLPLVAIPEGAAEMPVCETCFPPPPSTTVTVGARTYSAPACAGVEFVDDAGNWAPMTAEVSRAVAAARAAGIMRIGVGHFTYQYDWARMEQLNLDTGRTRKIRFV